MTNRLAQETSPYLLQHRDNPVDWYPWGEEALARARAEDKPILLSVGYSACHWCHVMERESFEDQETAAYMNEHFVNIKVDREERPDVDAIYMEAVQSITGQGGWPMTVFLDPEGVPFYGGTYFPPDEGRGMPSFRMVMEAVIDAFERKREEIRERAGETPARLGAVGLVGPGAERPEAAQLAEAIEKLCAGADRKHGGFGGAPKFPPASALELLMARGEREHRRAHARRDAGRRHLRPARRRLRPLRGRRRLARPPLREDALRQRPAGARLPARLAASATSATAASARRRWTGCCARCAAPRAASTRPSTPTPRARRAGSTSGRRTRSEPSSARRRPSRISGTTASARRQLRGRSILHLAAGRRLGRAGQPRRGPPRPLRGAGQAGLAGPRRQAADLLERAGDLRPGRGRGRARARGLPRRRPPLRRVRARLPARRDGHLLRTYKDGDARLNGYLEDHAYLLEALLTLYEASFEARWFERARDLAETMIGRFGDPERGGFFSTSADHEQLIARRKEIGDHPIPADNSAAALGLLRLAALTGEREYERQAEGVFALFARSAILHPQSFAHLLRALDFHLSPVQEVALVGDDLSALAAVVRSTLRPHLVLAGGPAGGHRAAAARDRPTAASPPLTSAKTSPVRRLSSRQRNWRPSSRRPSGGWHPGSARRKPRPQASPPGDRTRRPQRSGSMRATCLALSSPSQPAAVPSGSSSPSGSSRSSSRPDRPTCPASSKTPKATRPAPTCPASAESTAALEATESLQDGEIAPAVIVYRRDSGLTPADRLAIIDTVKR